jgi:hypothetical protein
MTKSIRKRYRLDHAHAKALAPLMRSVEWGGQEGEGEDGRGRGEMGNTVLPSI